MATTPPLGPRRRTRPEDPAERPAATRPAVVAVRPADPAAAAIRRVAGRPAAAGISPVAGRPAAAVERPAAGATCPTRAATLRGLTGSSSCSTKTHRLAPSPYRTS